MNLMAEAGFRNPQRHSLTFGITCLYIGDTEIEGKTGQSDFHGSFTNLS
jgi:hypothetical protein